MIHVSEKTSFSELTSSFFEPADKSYSFFYSEYVKKASQNKFCFAEWIAWMSVQVVKYLFPFVKQLKTDQGAAMLKWHEHRTRGGREANGPAAAAKVGAGTEQPHGHSGLCVPAA